MPVFVLFGVTVKLTVPPAREAENSPREVSVSTVAYSVKNTSVSSCDI
jgi:hypothetical protein